MIVVGISGRAGAGKDSLADELVRNHGFTRVGFADALKESLLVLNPFVPTDEGRGFERLSELVGREGWERAKRNYPEVRRLLQSLGAEAVRDRLGKDMWIHVADREVQRHDRVVIPDVRYRNETDYVRGYGGIVVSIRRPLYSETDGTHSSEQTDRLPYDVLLINDGDLDDLQAKASEIAELVNG